CLANLTAERSRLAATSGGEQSWSACSPPAELPFCQSERLVTRAPILLVLRAWSQLLSTRPFGRSLAPRELPFVDVPRDGTTRWRRLRPAERRHVGDDVRIQADRDRGHLVRVDLREANRDLRALVAIECGVVGRGEAVPLLVNPGAAITAQP